MSEIEPSVGDKRPCDVSPNHQKRSKKETGADLKKVAEIVLVLSAMGKMRGGVGPTAVEKELMGEARGLLAKVCEGFAPKDLFPKEAFGGLIDDLGLNKVNEERIGFKAPTRLSVAEKVKESKLKMERAEDLSLHSSPQSAQRLQVNSCAAVESYTHSVQKSHLGNSNRMAIPASPLGHVTPSSSTAPSPYQLPTSEIRPTVSASSHSTHLGMAALPRVNRPPINGPVHPSQVQVTVNHSANSATRTPTWTVQHHPAQPGNVGSNNKVPINMSLGVGGPTNVKSGLPFQAASRTIITQTTRPPSQGTNSVHQLPAQNAHTETAKIVQKLLQPKVSDRPIWDPPSRDYMNKALTCQMCTSMVTDTDSVLVCDVCEKGYHLKCLQMTYQKSFAGEEWHCGRCLAISNGKPLPPKYGRVLRNTSTPKMSSDSPAILLTKRIDASDVKGGNLRENVPTNVATDKSGSTRDDTKAIKESADDSSKAKRDGMSNMVNSSLSGRVSSMDSSGENVLTGVASDKSASKRDDAEEIKESTDDSSKAKWVDTSNLVNSFLSGPVSYKDSSGENLHNDTKVANIMPSSSAKSNLVPDSSEKSQIMVNGLPNDEESPSTQYVDMVPSSAKSNLIPDSSEKSQAMVNELWNDEASLFLQSVDMVSSSAKPSLVPDSSENSQAMPNWLPNDEANLLMQSVATVPSSSAQSNLVPDSSEKSQIVVTGLPNDEASSSMQSFENNMVVNSEDALCEENLNNAHQSTDTAQEVKCDNPSNIATCTGSVNTGGSYPGGLRAVSWVGEPTQVLDEKIYYESVCINEHLYKVMDYVLVRFEDEKIVPSKLQAMWEDKNTTMKWVTVNRCYFPGDLPEAVGRPCGLQSREVYESTKGTLLMASLLESPCEVLPPRKFEEEIERISLSGTQQNDNLPPIFLCKWIYDEAKGLFRDISC